MYRVLAITLLGCSTFFWSCTQVNDKASPQKSIEIPIDTTGFGQKAKLLNNTISTADSLTNYLEVIRLLDQLLDIRTKQRDTALTCLCLANKGLNFNKLADRENNKAYRDSSLVYNKKAFDLCPNTPHIVAYYADDLVSKGDYDKAYLHQKNVLKYLVGENDIHGDNVQAYRLLSYICFNKKSYQEGLDYATLGLKWSTSDNQANILNVMGLNLMGLHRHEESQGCFQKAVTSINDAHNVDLGNIYTNLGIISKRKGEYQRALSEMRIGLTHKTTPEGLAASYDNIADVLLLQNQKDAAIEHYQMAIDTLIPSFKSEGWKPNPRLAQCQQAFIKTDLMGYLRDKAMALQHFGEIELAVKTYDLADSLCDFIRSNNLEDASKLFWREEAYPLYVNAVSLCHKMGRYKDAFKFIEKSRAILHLEALTGEGNYQQYPMLISLEDLQGNLREDEAFVMYLMPNLSHTPSDDTSFVATITQKNGIDLHKIYCPRKELLGFTSKLQDKVGFPSLGDFSKWYTHLLSPLSLPPHIKKLTISTSGDISAVPFDGLVIPPGSLQGDQVPYVIYRYSTSYAYSATIQYRQWHRKNNGMLLGYAPVEFDQHSQTQLAKLPNTKADLDQLIKSSSGQKVVLEKATKAHFMREAGKYKYIQLFTHAVADTTGPPRIYFHDSLLTLPEIYQMKLNADMVFLTACQSAIGEYQHGEGVNSLARGFAIAGIPATIATLWSAPEIETSKITLAFYQKLKEGLPKDEALRQAKLDYLRDQRYGNGNDMAYYWASLQLTGDTQNSNEANGWFAKIILASIVFASLLFVLFLLKKRRIKT